MENYKGKSCCPLHYCDIFCYRRYKHENKKGINSIGVKENFIKIVVGICHAESPERGNKRVGADFYK